MGFSAWAQRRNPHGCRTDPADLGNGHRLGLVVPEVAGLGISMRKRARLHG